MTGFRNAAAPRAQEDGDMTRQINDPQANIFPLDLSITRIDKHTQTIWSFFMAPSAGARPVFRAGQVAILRMGDQPESYIAFASAPEDADFEFLIKHLPEKSGLARIIFDPGFGEHIVLKNIIGRGFPVEEHKGHDLVFVAMGVGLAPLRSTLRHISHSRDEYGRLIVLYGARKVDDFCFEEEMSTEWRELGVELRQVISQPNSDWSGPTGYVQSLLDNIVPGLKDPVALICGSSEMIEQTRSRLTNLGFAVDKILTNY